MCVGRGFFFPPKNYEMRLGRWCIVNIAVVNIATSIKTTNATAIIDDPTIVIETIDATIALNAMTRTQRVPSPMTRRMIAGAITSRKRATRPCIMTSPLCQALAICPEEGVDLVPDLLCILGPVLAQAAGATTTPPCSPR
jgi:hypothetical protein